jgi:octaprenyl-diphosphate synthase
MPSTDEARRRLDAIYAPIAEELAQVDQVLARELKSRASFIDRLVRHSANYRGKRLRPALVLLTARACGTVRPEHTVLAAVVEMIHTATLVHDDVLDEANVRRSLSTVNAHWGNEASVLLGDYLFTHAFHLASSLESTLACRLVGQATNLVCEGELHQIHHRGNLDLGEDEYLEIIAGKTAELYACCCRLGAHFSGAPRHVEEAMARYGRQLGIAFQIADDLLDLVGDEQETGKSLGTDLEKQKCTLPTIYLLRASQEETLRKVSQILTGDGNHKRQSLAPYLRAGGALEYAEHRAREFAELARSEIQDLPDSDSKAVLEEICRFAVSRKW